MKSIYKKSLSVLLTGALLLNSSVVFAEETAPSEEIYTASYSFEDDGVTSDQLLAGYIESKLFGDMGISMFGTTAYSRLGTGGKALYDAILAKVSAVAAGTVTSSQFTFDTGFTFTIDELGITKGGDKAAALKSTLAKTMDALMFDHPYEFYWFNKMSGYQYSYSYNQVETDVTYTIPTIDMFVDYSYRSDLSSSFVLDAAKTTAANTAVANAKTIVNENKDKTPIERLTAYKDAICDLVSYDHAAADELNNLGTGDILTNLNPWQIINVFDNNTSTNVVCEGYSKAFQYLCDLDGGLTCYTVTGNMAGGTGSGGHMWNIVNIDGKNYLVDVTNCDGDGSTNSIGYPDKLFLKGIEEVTAAESYQITIGSQTVTFTYDEDTTAIYDTSELTVSKTDYSEEAVSYTAPEAKTSLKYTGSAQELITAGEITDDTFLYSLTGGDDYAAAIPTGTDAGDYTVYYKAENDNTISGTVKGSIAKAAPEVTAPKAKAELAFTGSALELITAGTTTGGTMQYSLDGTSYSTAIPTGTEAKTYTVYYKVVGDTNYEDVAAASIEVTIGKDKAVVVTAPEGINKTYTGSPIALIETEGTANGGTIQYSLEENGTYSAEIPTATDADEYTVYYKAVGDANHSDSAVSSVTAVINKADVIIGIAPAAIENLVYTGEAQALITKGTVNGGVIKYSLDNINFSEDIPTAIDAGSYKVYYSVEPINDNYYCPFMTSPIDVTVAAAKNEFTKAVAAAEDLVYTGKAQALLSENGVAKYGEIQYKLDGGEYSETAPVATDAGTYTVYYKVEGGSNYDGISEASVTVTISKAAAANITVDGLKTQYIYDNGNEIKPEFTLKYGEITLTKGTDYTVAYENNTALDSTAAITITLAGNYTGSITKTFEIVSHIHNYTFTASGAVITAVCDGEGACTAGDDLSVTIKAPEGDLVYDGSEKTASIVGTINGVETPSIVYTKDGEEYNATPKDAGEYIASITIEGKTASVSYTVKKAENSFTAIPTGKTGLIYTGSKLTLLESYGTAIGGTIEVSLDGESWSETLSDVTDAGEYTVYYRVNGGENYEDVAAATLTVNVAKANPVVTAPTAKESLSYSGLAQELISAGKTIGGTLQYKLGEDGTYSEAIPTAINAGDYKVYYKVTGDSNYNDSVENFISVSIAKKLATATVHPTANKLTYNKTAQALITKGETADGEFVYSLTEGGEFTTSVPTETTAGTYIVYYYVKADGNHFDGTVNSISVTIEQAVPEYTVPTGITVEYGKALGEISLPDGFKFNGYSDTSTGDVGDNEFTATYYPDDYVNYKTVENIKITITVTKADVYVIEEPKAVENLIYNAAEQELVTNGAIGTGGTIQFSTDGEAYSEKIPTGKNAGEYTVYYKVVGDKNHNDTEPKEIKVTIVKSGAIPPYTAPTASEITYGDTLADSVLTDTQWKWADETIVPGVSNTGFVVYLDVDDKNYDYVPFAPTYVAERHRLEVTISVSVKPADISVKADDKYIVVGAELPTPTYTVTGLVGSDELTVKPEIGYSGADNMTIGEYDIIISGAEANENYNSVTHTNGTLYVGLCDHEGTMVIKYNDTEHWYDCTKCGDTKLSSEKHTGGTATCSVKAECTVCEQAYGEFDNTKHNPAEKWAYDTDSHWHDCSDCGADLSKAAHSGGTATCAKQAVCETCSIPYGKTLGHSYKTEWSTNETHHWYDCEKCSEKNLYAEHSYGEWTVVTEATATEKGLEKRTCTCGVEETRDIPATGETPTVTTTAAPVIPNTSYPIYTGAPSTGTPTTTTTTTTVPPEDDVYEEEDDEEVPQIKGENGKKGWEVISDEIAKAKKGDKISVDMNGATKLPKNILKEIKGKKITVVIELDNGFTWTIKGEDVKSPKAIDLGVSFNADIPAKVINKVTGTSSNVTISIAHDGEFGFKATLGVKLGKENKSLYANLYYYNENSGKAEFVCADKIDSKGVAELEFNHASDYIIVIDEENHAKKAEDVSGDTDDNEDEDEVDVDVDTDESDDSEEVNGGDDDASDYDDDPNPFTGVTISFAGVVLSAAAALFTRKRKQK